METYIDASLLSVADRQNQIITDRKRSCGKVMFSQVSVCSHGVYLPTMPWGRKTRPSPPPHKIRSIGGRYASYWNTYLLSVRTERLVIKMLLSCPTSSVYRLIVRKHVGEKCTRKLSVGYYYHDGFEHGCAIYFTDRIRSVGEGYVFTYVWSGSVVTYLAGVWHTHPRKVDPPPRQTPPPPKGQLAIGKHPTGMHSCSKSNPSPIRVMYTQHYLLRQHVEGEVLLGEGGERPVRRRTHVPSSRWTSTTSSARPPWRSIRKQGGISVRPVSKMYGIQVNKFEQVQELRLRQNLRMSSMAMNDGLHTWRLYLTAKIKEKRKRRRQVWTSLYAWQINIKISRLPDIPRIPPPNPERGKIVHISS